MRASKASEEVALNDCAFSVHSVAESSSDVLTYYGILRDYLQHEDSLINSRLTWSLTVHGFLFATFGFVANKTMELLCPGAEVSFADLAFPVLQILIAGVGGAVAFYSHGAIVAAHVALQHLTTIAHASGPLKIQYPSSIPQAATGRQIVLLPGIRGGGASVNKTEAASRYYVNLPIIIMAVWILLGLWSGYILYNWLRIAFHHRLLSVLGSG